MPAQRFYDAVLAEHLASHRQMAFVSGPRQVGKTTTCRLQADTYINWTTWTTANWCLRARDAWPTD